MLGLMFEYQWPTQICGSHDSTLNRGRGGRRFKHILVRILMCPNTFESDCILKIYFPSFHNTVLFAIYLATFSEILKEIARVMANVLKRPPTVSCNLSIHIVCNATSMHQYILHWAALPQQLLVYGWQSLPVLITVN